MPGANNNQILSSLAPVIVRIITVIAAAVGVIYVMDLRLARLEEKFTALIETSTSKFVLLDKYVDESNRMGNRITHVESATNHIEKYIGLIHIDLNRIHDDLKEMNRQKAKSSP